MVNTFYFRFDEFALSYFSRHDDIYQLRPYYKRRNYEIFGSDSVQIDFKKDSIDDKDIKEIFEEFKTFLRTYVKVTTSLLSDINISYELGYYGSKRPYAIIIYEDKNICFEKPDFKKFGYFSVLESLLIKKFKIFSFDEYDIKLDKTKKFKLYYKNKLSNGEEIKNEILFLNNFFPEEYKAKKITFGPESEYDLCPECSKFTILFDF